jgi:hypothetical protein
MVRGHGIGKLNGDGFRMPGAFVLIDGNVVVEHRATSAADQPDYLSMLTLADARSMQAQSERSRKRKISTAA